MSDPGLSLASFPPLGPPQSAHDPKLRLVLRDLLRDSAYVVTVLRRHPTSSGMVLVRQARLDTDRDGTADLNGPLTLKLMQPVPKVALPEEQTRWLSLLESGDHLLISAEAIDEERRVPVRARQTLTG